MRPVRAEIRTLLWLQWRLTLSLFRSRRPDILARLGRLLLGVFMLLFSLPAFAGMAAGLGFLLAMLSPAAALELVVLVNAGLLLLWLVLPASYNSSIVERFEVSRLLIHPVSHLGLVVGSSLVSLTDVFGVMTVLMVVGQVAGLAWHAPLAVSLLAAAALVLTAVLLFSGRIMEDVYDLVAGDRRLRAAMLFVLSLPLLIPVFGNLFLQLTAQEYGSLREWLAPLIALPDLSGLSFVESTEALLFAFRPSRLLFWLPTTWASGALAYPVLGRWGAAVALLVLALAAGLGLLWWHSRLVARLMQGAGIRLRTQRVRSERWQRNWPGPPQLWALLLKDWICLRRSPATAQALAMSPLVALGLGVVPVVLVRGLAAPDSGWHQTLPILVAVLLTVAANLALTSISSNYFGTVDRDGLATLLLSPVDRRYVLISGNLAALVLAMGLSLLFLLPVALLSGMWVVIVGGLVLALLLNVSAAPLYTLVGILGARRQNVENWNQDTGNLWTLLAWPFAIAPALLLVVVPYLLWRPALLVTLPLAVVYAVGLNLLTLRPLARLLDRRAGQIVQAVSEQS